MASDLRFPSPATISAAERRFIDETVDIAVLLEILKRTVGYLATLRRSAVPYNRFCAWIEHCTPRSQRSKISLFLDKLRRGQLEQWLQIKVAGNHIPKGSRLDTEVTVNWTGKRVVDEDVVGFLMKEHLVNNQDSHCDSFMAKAMGKDGLSLVSRLPGYAAYLDNELHSYIEVLHLLYILFNTCRNCCLQQENCSSEKRLLLN